MNFSSSNGANHTAPIPVSSFMYRDIAAPVQSNAREQRPAQATLQENQPPAVPTIPVAESNELVQRARAEAVAEAEKRLKQDYEDRLEKEAATIRKTLELFEGRVRRSSPGSGDCNQDTASRGPGRPHVSGRISAYRSG